MNLSKYKINILLKFTLIFSIILNLLNSVSASTPPEASKESSLLIKLSELNLGLSELNLGVPIFVTLIIFFISWYFNKDRQQKQFSNLEKKQNKIISSFDRLSLIDNKLNNLEIIKREIIKQVQENNQKITDSKIEIIEFINKQQVEQPVNSYSNIGIESNNNHAFSTFTTEQAEHQLDTHSYTPVAVVDRIPQFVDKYNQDKQSLSNEAVAKVSATEASLNKRRMGDESKLMLENTIQKRYLIVQEDGDYYLVPHAKIKINEHNKSSLEDLFECVSFIPEYTDFHLIKPAKVSQVEPELWQLDNRGKIEFS